MSKLIPWYDQPSDLSNEEKLEVLQIMLKSHIAGGDMQAVAMVKEWERVLSDRIAEKELLGETKE